MSPPTLLAYVRINFFPRWRRVLPAWYVPPTPFRRVQVMRRTSVPYLLVRALSCRKNTSGLPRTPAAFIALRRVRRLRELLRPSKIIPAQQDEDVLRSGCAPKQLPSLGSARLPRAAMSVECPLPPWVVGDFVSNQHIRHRAPPD